jgi:hypothetical protein
MNGDKLEMSGLNSFAATAFTMMSPCPQHLHQNEEKQRLGSEAN